jgi:hypothetical protein
MNNKQAKRLRNIAFSDQEKKEPTKYKKMLRKVNENYVDTGAIKCKRPREFYLNLKKQYKNKVL